MDIGSSGTHKHLDRHFSFINKLKIRKLPMSKTEMSTIYPGFCFFLI